MSRTILIYCLAVLFKTVMTSMEVRLSSNGPAVLGSNITFTATVTGNDGSEQLMFDFMDDAQPQHQNTFETSSNISNWTVEYSKELYSAGEYTVEVILKKCINWGFLKKCIFYMPESKDSRTFKLTDSLNGDLVFVQNNTQRPNNFVSVNVSVSHIIKLPENEIEFLSRNTSKITTYWFKDCVYFGQTADFTFNFTYDDVMVSHKIDALVIADHEPLPPLPTTTTTTTTTSTTITTTTTTTPKPPVNITTIAPPSTTSSTSNGSSSDTLPVHKVTKRALSKNTIEKKLPEAFICKNTTVIPISSTSTYGHYQQTVEVREPIGKINITGRNWLQHGDLMNLNVKYYGSPPFNYCAEYKPGQYNVTGNETCKSKLSTVSNNFPLVHYFPGNLQTHTVVVIIENDIGTFVSRATINIYKATVHAQLSVIVVPVVFCLVAVILVMFGVAYYQHRSRYNVEVADFDFGQQSHFDYKTFRERLRDSFRNAFNFGRQEDTDPLTGNSRYESMT